MVFEFVVAAVLFFSIVFYIINILDSNVAAFSRESGRNVLQSDAVQISEILLTSRGKWNGSDVIIPGISGGWPVVEKDKIQKLNLSCRNNYTRLRKKLGLGENTRFGNLKQVKIRITQNETLLLDCGPKRTPKESGSIDRFAVSEQGKLLRVQVEVW